MSAILENAETQYVEAYGVRYAYRRLGCDSGVPLILLQHFTGTMDSWDPVVVNSLAENRPVIVFNNAGIGTSGGKTPDNIDQMTTDAESFITALGFALVDLLGFSLGGFIAQLMATRHAVKIRKIVLAGTAPKGGEQHLMQVVDEAFAKGADDVRLPLFFTSSTESQAAGQAFLDRALVREDGRDPESDDAVSNPQAASIIGWCAENDPGHKSLKAIRQPTLIVHGSDDTMLPSANAYEMFKSMPNATLVLYPDSGHGALFQYAKTFVAHVKTFLDN